VGLFVDQLLFLSGITLIIGPQKTFFFFARKNKLRGSVCFIGGILIVIVLKRPVIGMVVETFGFLNLFGCVRAFRTRLTEADATLLSPEISFL
jgi:hypothetical protein